MCVAALGLAGCATGPKGVRFIDGAGGAGSKPVAQPIQQFSAGEIQTAIVGKTFQYTRSDGNGFVTYNADGTFNYQDDNKGEGTGKWETSNSLFCEIFGLTPFRNAVNSRAPAMPILLPNPASWK